MQREETECGVARVKGVVDGVPRHAENTVTFFALNKVELAVLTVYFLPSSV